MGDKVFGETDEVDIRNVRLDRYSDTLTLTQAPISSLTYQSAVYSDANCKLDP